MATTNARSAAGRRTTGLVTAALLALSATTAPASVEAAARAGGAATARRHLKSPAVAQPTDPNDVEGKQCVKCCKPESEIRSDGAGGTGGAGGSSGKGGKGSGGGGRRTKKAGNRNNNRRLATARGKDSNKRAQEFRELVHDPKEAKAYSIKCVECPVPTMKECVFTEDDFSNILRSDEDTPKVVSCLDKDENPKQVEPCPSSEELVVKTEFIVSNEDLETYAHYDPDRPMEGEQDEKINLADHGGCGTMTTGTSPTQITFFMKAEHYPPEGQSREDARNDVAGYLQGNIAKEAFGLCEDNARNRKLEGEDGSTVTGFVSCPGANPYHRTGSCDNTIDGAECNVYVGQVCVYCHRDASNPECYAEGVKTLQANSNLAQTDAIPRVSVVGAQMDSEVTLSGGDLVMGGGGAVSATVGADASSYGENGSGALGIALGVGLGVCALLVVLLAVRKNRKAHTRDISFLDAEDMYSVDGDNIHLKPGDSSFDGTEIMSDASGSPSPNTKWRKSRPGHVVGEDDSVLSGRDRSMVPRNLSYTGGLEVASPNDLARSGSGVDVHQCNSAMCEICLARGVNPRFIPSNLEDTYIEDLDRLNSSDLSYASRTYPMEDTVDF